ncbi:MAG: hypothetical protein RL615_1036 [Pseudomonadota bacterium]
MQDIGKDSTLVKVDGAAITRQELDNAVKLRADRLQQQQGRVDSAMVNSVPFKQAVLNEIIQQRLLAYEIKALKLSISPEALARDLTQIPEIKALYNNGQFDAERYKKLLASNNLTVDQFENGRRHELKTRHVLTAVVATGIGSRKVAEQVSIAFETEREVQVLRFSPNDFVSKVNPSQQDIESFYQSNINAPKKFAEKADLFANMAYEQADSLKPVADRLSLPIQKASNITRGGLRGAPADHPFNNPKLLAAIFADDAVKNRRNIEALELSPGKIISARVITHKPQAALPLSQIQADVKKQVSLRMAQELAIKTGQERFEALQKNPSESAGFTAGKWVSRNKPADLTASGMDAVMSANAKQLPAVVSAQANDGGFAIYRVNKVQKPLQADAKLRTNQARQVADLGAQSEAAAYFESVKDRAGVKQVNSVK